MNIQARLSQYAPIRLTVARNRLSDSERTIVPLLIQAAQAMNVDSMHAAITSLAGQLLRFQGDGDYDGVLAFMEHYGRTDDDLKRDIDRIEAERLPLGFMVEQEHVC